VAAPHLSYGPPRGIPAFRSAVAAHFAREKRAEVAPDRVLATNSAASALALVARHLLRAGDEVVVQDPVDFLVAESARRAGAELRTWVPEDGRFTLAGLQAALTERTRVIAVCHPHNPLGTLWTPEEVAAIAAFAAERGVAILSDEVWSDVVLDGLPFASFAGFAQAWTVYGLSKGYALAGLRIGAVVAPDAEAAARFALEAGFEHTIEGVSTLSQVAAVAALEQAGAWRANFLRHCAAQRDFARLRLAGLTGVRLGPSPQATFVCFVDVRATGLDETELAARIERHARVRVVPGSPRWFGAGAAGHVRLSLATTQAVLDDALGRIAAAWPAVTADAGDQGAKSTM
jgi:aspartate/methionine/tyrosine aminotransferase